MHNQNKSRLGYLGFPALGAVYMIVQFYFEFPLAPCDIYLCSVPLFYNITEKHSYFELVGTMKITELWNVPKLLYYDHTHFL